MWSAASGSDNNGTPSNESRWRSRSLISPSLEGPSRRELVVLAAVIAAIAASASALESSVAFGGGVALGGGDCGLRREHWSAALAWRAPPTSPQLLEGLETETAFAAATRRDALLSRWGKARVSLTSSNSYSERERVASLREYVAEADFADATLRLANESWYLFGPMRALDELVATYHLPQCTGAWCDPDVVTPSFGMGGVGSGVSFHTHGSGFAETVHGRKRWLFYAPSDKPPPGHDPDVSSARWIADVLPTLARATRPAYDCVLGPGELLFFPKDWWHATLNLDAHTVFVSTFADDTQEEGASAAPRLTDPFAPW